MKKIMKKAIPFLLILAFCLPVASLAVNFDPYGQIENVDLGQPEEDEVPSMVVTVINIILSFLALIAVVLIIYGGFTYMLSGGNPEKMKKARDILIATAIGLIIVLAAWGITIYLVNEFSIVTTGAYE